MKQQQQRVCETAKSGQERSIRFALAPIVYTLALGSLLCSSLSCCLPSSCCEEASCLAGWLAGQLNQPRRERESKAITSRRRRLAEVRSSRLGTSHFCKRLDRTRGFINVARPHINYGLRGNNDNQYRHDLIKQAANRYSSILTPNVLYKDKQHHKRLQQMMAKSSHKLDKEIIIFMCIIDSGNSRPAELETMITFGECRDATRLCKQPARSFVLRFQQVLSLLLLLMSILLFRHDYRPRQS